MTAGAGAHHSEVESLWRVAEAQVRPGIALLNLDPQLAASVRRALTAGQGHDRQHHAGDQDPRKQAFHGASLPLAGASVAPEHEIPAWAGHAIVAAVRGASEENDEKSL